MASDYGIGARLPRLEDARFLEGRGQFCADINLPGTLHAAFVRSSHAHAIPSMVPSARANPVIDAIAVMARLLTAARANAKRCIYDGASAPCKCG